MTVNAIVTLVCWIVGLLVLGAIIGAELERRRARRVRRDIQRGRDDDLEGLARHAVGVLRTNPEGARHLLHAEAELRAAEQEVGDQR